MKVVGRIIFSGFVGALVGALSTSIPYFIMVKLDGGRTDEAFLYSVLVAILGALAGSLIGFTVGAADLHLLGGALVGAAVTVAVVLFYVVSSAGPGEYLYFLSESRVILVVLALPAILTGGLTAWAKDRRASRQAVRAAEGAPR